jgi:hypothetical protein
VRIVIEEGDALTIEALRSAAAAAALEVVDGGGAPSALIHRFAEGAELEQLADAEAAPAEHVEPPPGEPPLNPLRAGREAARGPAGAEMKRGAAAVEAPTEADLEGGAAPQPETRGEA